MCGGTYGILYKVRRSGECSYEADHFQNVASLKLAVATEMRLLLYMCITTRICHKTMNAFCRATNKKAPTH